MNNDKKSRQPMYMRASVSSAFDQDKSSKNNIVPTIFFVIFIAMIVSLITWALFFDGALIIKNLISGLFGPEIK